MKAEHDKLSKEQEVKITREVKYQWGWKSKPRHLFRRDQLWLSQIKFINSVQYKSF